MVYFPINGRAPRGRYPFEVAVVPESSKISNVHCKFQLKHEDIVLEENFYELAQDILDSLTSGRLNTVIKLKVPSFPHLHIREQRLSGLHMNTEMLKWMKSFQGCSLLQPAPLRSKVRGRFGNYRLFENDELPSYELIAVFRVTKTDRTSAQDA